MYYNVLINDLRAHPDKFDQLVYSNDQQALTFNTNFQNIYSDSLCKNDINQKTILHNDISLYPAPYELYQYNNIPQRTLQYISPDFVNPLTEKLQKIGKTPELRLFFKINTYVLDHQQQQKLLNIYHYDDVYLKTQYKDVQNLKTLFRQQLNFIKNDFVVIICNQIRVQIPFFPNYTTLYEIRDILGQLWSIKEKTYININRYNILCAMQFMHVFNETIVELIGFEKELNNSILIQFKMLLQRPTRDEINAIIQKYRALSLLSNYKLIYLHDDQQVPIFKINDIIFSEFALTKLTLNWNQFEIIFSILEKFIKTDINTNISSDDPGLLTVMDAPTGSGKTFTFILAGLMNSWIELQNKINDRQTFTEQAKLKYIKNIPFDFEQFKLKTIKQHINSVQTIIFVNTHLVGLNGYLEACKLTKLDITLVDMIITKDPISGEITSDLVVYKRSRINFSEKQIYSSPQQEYLRISSKCIPITEDVYVSGTWQKVCNFLITESNYKGERQFLDMRNFRYRGGMGSMIVCPLHIYRFLHLFGLIDFTTAPTTVVYDEIDTYYQFNKLDEFHRFYSKQFFNLKAKNVIFASATIDPSIIDVSDINLSQKQMQYTVSRLKFEACSNISITSKLITPSTTYSVIQLYDDQEYLLSKLFPISSKIYCYYNLNTPTLQYAYINKQDQCITRKLLQQQILLPTILSRNDMVKTLITQFNNVYITNKKLRFINFTNINKAYFDRQTININAFSTYNPFINCQIQMCRDNNSIIGNLLDYLTRQLNNNVNILVVPIGFAGMDIAKLCDCLLPAGLKLSFANYTKLDNNQLYNNIKFLSNYELQLQKKYKNKIYMEDETTEVQSDKYYKKFISTNMPFNLQFAELIQSRSVSFRQHIYKEQHPNKPPDQFKEVGDLKIMARGVDIPQLNEVIFIMPGFVDNIENIGLNFVEFKQLGGRVGRAGKTGQFTIFTYGDSVDRLDANNLGMVCQDDINRLDPLDPDTDAIIHNMFTNLLIEYNQVERLNLTKAAGPNGVPIYNIADQAEWTNINDRIQRNCVQTNELLNKWIIDANFDTGLRNIDNINRIILQSLLDMLA